MNAIGKILRSNTRGFVFGCKVTRDDVPIFGSFVATRIQYRDATVYGLIHNIEIGDDGMTRMLSVADQALPEDIEWARARRVPVEASVLCMGYLDEGGQVRHALPAQPPVTLDTVRSCADAEIAAFTLRPDWLRLAIDSRDAPVDELLAAAIRIAAGFQRDSASFTQACGRELARLLANDSARLESLLRRIY